ncbi:MAG TPA: dienelactone hydrolase family protein [Thermoanaerobaculaceae bacterium]|nr:dienelactone hydrolase family protein [Thermoanaerobaculaceae bacterium]HRS15216.1 dienelactone hydrolase family protein [Thermoanaerobaculaceae bacterium]
MRAALVPSLVLAVASLPVLAGCAVPAHKPRTPRGFLLESVRAGDRELPYALYVPPSFHRRRAWPLVLFLHGSGECGSDGLRQLSQGLPQAILAAPEKWPTLVLCPQKPTPDTEWEAWDDVLMAMVERVRSAYPVDEHRIALTGLSQGGHGAWVLGARHADLWSAVAPVCGYVPVRRGAPGIVLDRQAIARALARTRVWAFHGEDDPIVSVGETREVAAALEDAGAPPRLTIYPDLGHDAWLPAYQENGLAVWLLAARAR